MSHESNEVANVMSAAPVGDVTFLFTDIEGSTALWDRFPDAMPDALAEHDRRIRAVVDAHDGYVFTTAGDSFAVAFSSAHDAVTSTLEIQRAMLDPAVGVELRVRIGLHAGTATLRDGDYFGGAVNRGARVAGCAHGGQLVLSQSAVDLLAGVLPDGAELLDLGAHRLRGLVEPERIHQLCHEDLPRVFPRLRTVEGPSDSLPTQLTSFVGREREVIDVVALAADHRLITLSGAGGAGKTRLSLRVAEELAPAFPDGLRFAELGAITDAEVLTDEVAQRFAVTAIGDEPIIRTLVESIGDQRILLVLDNCEHIVDAVAALCRQLLLGCPNLHLLATSRERLGVEGEVLFRVPSLGLPEPGLGVEASIEFDAVRLFAERARLVSPAFEVTADNVDAVCSICRHLDGIPLALELAAARTRSMSPAQIVERLGQRFSLLTGSGRLADSRQETLLSTIEWSHDLLSERERMLFRHVGVFPDHFGLEAAERVLVGGSIDEFDVIDLLAALVDKSMVTTEISHDDSTRYSALETIREFARRQLEAVDEREQLDLRHAEYFAELAETLQAMNWRGDLVGALAGLEREESNFRAALRFALDSGETVLAARTVGGLGHLWYASGQNREGLQWCIELFEADPDLPDLVRASALHSYGSAFGSGGKPKLGIEVLTEEVELRRELGDPHRLGPALNNLGNLLCDGGDFEGAEPVLAEAIECFREIGVSASLPMSTLGYALMHVGRYPQAEQNYRDSMAEAKQADVHYSIAVGLVGLGNCFAWSGQTDEARRHLVDAGERFEELSVGPGLIDVGVWLGVLEREAGSPSVAAEHFLAALDAPGDHWFDDADHWIMQFTASVIDDDQTGAVLLGAAAAAYERSGTPQPKYVLEDLESISTAVAERLGEDVFGRCARAGARRTRAEAVAIARAALVAAAGVDRS